MFLRRGSRALGLSQDLCLAFSSCTCRGHRLDTRGAGARGETMEDFRDSVNATEMVLTPIFRRLRQTSACKVEFSRSLRHSSHLSGVVLVVV
jgi:hypothetical protein